MTRPLPPALSRVLPEHSQVTENGELMIGGCSVPELARDHGTPLYAFDEVGLRNAMRRTRDGLAARWPRSRVCFASKALPVVAAYAIAQSEGLSIDVVGEGELRLALAAGVDPARLVLHGNAKSRSELTLAKSVGVGLVVVDNLEDVALLSRMDGLPQDVLIRVLPEIDANTHPSISTGGRGSKFGLPVEQVRPLITQLRTEPQIRLRGLHLHLGSQIHETEPFARAIAVLAELGEFDIYNVGGGLGVNYSETDDAPSLDTYLDVVAEAAHAVLPAGAELMIEPGRALVARSGITVYSVRNVKHTHDTFVAVDGGMSDQLNLALTDDRFTPLIADRATAVPDTVAQLVGRQCESGDLLVADAQLSAPASGDTVVIASTGAYGFTFVNNYNGALHPPVLFCRDGRSRLAVRRQSYEDLIAPHSPAFSVDWGVPDSDAVPHGHP